MKRAFVVNGTMANPRHIELDEPVLELVGNVEVTLRTSENSEIGEESFFDMISESQPGTRTKEDIDSQIAEERASWGDR